MRNLKRSISGILTALLLSLAIGIGGLGGALPEGAGIIESQAATLQETALSQVPAYSGSPWVAVNNNVPFFTAAELTTTPFETYSELDTLGRCGTAYANICLDIMPTTERGSIGDVRPTGWHSVRYNGIDGNYLYNRCHLIGWQLAGENANVRNLITGTRYLNVTAMLPFENMVADYVKETGNHVLYRATPVFGGNNLLAYGVLLEAESVEDQGAGVLFNVFCYNVQPGITIDYSDGSSSGPAFTGSSTGQKQSGRTGSSSGSSSGGRSSSTQSAAASKTTAAKSTGSSADTTAAYIGNANTGKFHRASCYYVSRMSAKNKVALKSREEAIAEGYVPCKKCNP